VAKPFPEEMAAAVGQKPAWEHSGDLADVIKGSRRAKGGNCGSAAPEENSARTALAPRTAHAQLKRTAIRKIKMTTSTTSKRTLPRASTAPRSERNSLQPNPKVIHDQSVAKPLMINGGGPGLFMPNARAILPWGEN